MALDKSEVLQQLAKVELDLQQLASTSQTRDAVIELSQAHARLSEIRDLLIRQEELDTQIQALSEIVDPEMEEMVSTEREALMQEKAILDKKLSIHTLKTLPDDEKASILEIRAGTGGTEAALFAEQLMRMYIKYSQSQGWEVEVSDLSKDAEGGLKTAVININTKGSYGKLRFESGVHRVQRVPVTEASGRIHTSTASLAVLPQVDDVKVVINDQDIRVDVYRSSGPGGQSVNTTDSAVRITHIPTGLIVTCQEGKSQLKNKEKAMAVLAAKLYALQIEDTQKNQDEARRLQIKSGERSAKIRTYNFQQSRVTDHRIKQTWYNINEILEGDLEEVVNSVQADMRS
jgi:peptide chain release factor 1